MNRDDSDLLSRVLCVLEPHAGARYVLNRGGRPLLGLPRGREAAARTLQLYQPQRRLARCVVGGLRCLVRAGLHWRVLRAFQPAGEEGAITPPLPSARAGTVGVLLGSPEHRVRRAVASFRREDGWEVAKIAFGPEGERLVVGEAGILNRFHVNVPGVPPLLGLHRGDGMAVLRLPYLTERRLERGEWSGALALLESWKTGRAAVAIRSFPEWRAIEDALCADEHGRTALRRLERQELKPVICHGDFARWNLLCATDGSLTVLDWEWGHPDGLPGIDLVHFFAQDARLVRRLSPIDTVRATARELQREDCARYLLERGWSGGPLLVILACLAYKQGAGHQDNAAMLRACLREFAAG